MGEFFYIKFPIFRQNWRILHKVLHFAIICVIMYLSTQEIGGIQMKKSIVIILEVIIILCLLLALFGKVLANQRENTLNLISSRLGSTIIAEKATYNHKANFLWMRAVVDLSAEPETRESFSDPRTILLTSENKLSELERLANRGTPIKTTATNFLWTDIKANPYGDTETKERFTYDRIALFKQENKPMPTKNIAEIQTTSTNFLWTDVTVNPYGDSATRETFSARRAILLKEEGKTS